MSLPKLGKIGELTLNSAESYLVLMKGGVKYKVTSVKSNLSKLIGERNA